MTTEITGLPTSTGVNPTDWFILRQGASDVKISPATLIKSHMSLDNPHGITKQTVGLGNVSNDAQLKVSSNLSEIPDVVAARTKLEVDSYSEVNAKIKVHTDLTNNPHNTTATQLGLGSVLNWGVEHNPRSAEQNKYASIRAVKALSSEIDAIVPSLVPKGTIVMWSPSENTIPVGWALCDGSTVNGITTPNLINRFIKGSSLAAAGTTGGEEYVTHSHTGTGDPTALTIAQIPEHKHTVPFGEHTHHTNMYPWGYNPIYGSTNQGFKGSDRDNVRPYTDSVGKGEPHSHSVSVNPTTIQINPVHFTLAFIMKVV